MTESASARQVRSWITYLAACTRMDPLERLFHSLRPPGKQPIVQLALPVSNAIPARNEWSNRPHHLPELVARQSRVHLLLRSPCRVEVGDFVFAAAGFAEGVDEGGEGLRGAADADCAFGGICWICGFEWDQEGLYGVAGDAAKVFSFQPIQKIRLHTQVCS